jgi:Protein of unknown function (DUF1329)
VPPSLGIAIARRAAAIALLLMTGIARAESPTARDALPELPFKEGDVIGYDAIEKIKDFLPPQFWENREFFFYEGMELEIGPTQRPYPVSPTYAEATARGGWKATIGRDGALENWIGGMPFDPAKLDCKGDPQAGTKIIWNFKKAWNGSGGEADWYYSYWDRGEQLPLYYKGTAKGIMLSRRVEAELIPNEGDLFYAEKRLSAGGITVDEPQDARGIMTLSYVYKEEDGPLDQARNQDTWVWVPDLRRTRRISSAQRTDAVAGTDFTVDDLRSFNGVPPQYDWKCLGSQRVLAPVNTHHLAYPYTDSYNFGPYGFSFASDRWELRDAWIIRMDPKNEDHPYDHKDIWIDKETYEPLYSAAYDRKKELWKLIWHNHRWTEDWKTGDPLAKGGAWVAPWPGVEQVNDLRTVGDIIVNVQTGTGNRIEFWNSSGRPEVSRGKIRTLIDIGRLNKGR